MTFELDDDPARIDFEVVWQYLSTDAYWGTWRTREQVRSQLDSAWRLVGAYDDGALVGFARAVSDGVGIAYLADVFVLPAYQGKGLGTAIVRRMIDEGPGADLRWMLFTRDAHGLYEKFGFGPPENALERPARLPS